MTDLPATDPPGIELPGTELPSADPPATGPSTDSPAIDLVGVFEIRELLVRPVSRDRVEELTFRDDFPPPAAVLAQGEVWLAEDVQAWLRRHADAIAALFTLSTPTSAEPDDGGPHVIGKSDAPPDSVLLWDTDRVTANKPSN